MPRIKMTPEQEAIDNQIIEMKANGVIFGDIAKDVGMTKSKLQSAYRRLGLSKPPDPNKRMKTLYRRNVNCFEKPKQKRVCKLCGKDPSPNWFYCPPCHHRLSEYEFDLEYYQEHRVNLGNVNGATISKPMGA